MDMPRKVSTIAEQFLVDDLLSSDLPAPAAQHA